MSPLGRTNRRVDLLLVASGSWVKVGRRHYRHVSGVEVKYRPNRWVWEVIGGRDDGRAYGTLSVAVYAATGETV